MADIFYLVRSGLGLPDYWHPHLDLQPGFLSGTIGVYPISMDVKADYPGQLDEQGIPVVFWGAARKATASPVNVVLYGLGSHDVFLRTKDEKYHNQLMQVLHWLADNCVPLGKGISWPNQIDIPAFGLKSPWFSGIIQGLALSLFVRAYQLDRSERWSKLAYQTWQGFQAPIAAGGICREVATGVIYEECPGPELDCVFNGMCCSLIGLWEAWHSGFVVDAEEDFWKGLKGLQPYLPQFDHAGWSLYSLSQVLGKPFLASPYYQRANGLLSQVVGLMAKENDFCTYGERWVNSGKSTRRKIAISLRIAFDRYMRAPSLLHYDKSQG
jgi:hypothetical protein